MPTSTRKIKQNKPSRKKTVRGKKTQNSNVQQKNNNFIKALIVGKKYTEKFDSHLDEYKATTEFKSLASQNPTLYMVNMVFLDCHKKSLFAELCKPKNKPLADALKYCFKLATIVKTKKSAEKYPIVRQLCSHGFNTIYDIILENTESFFLVSFVSHLASEKVIENPNDFIVYLSKNNVYKMLRDPVVIKGLQLVDLFTRIKRYQ